ncbi:MAG: hypothetical protein IJ740_05935 [Ruminococcus sp.]|nr:hypothetical protein [Ruminococcus sp.]
MNSEQQAKNLVYLKEQDFSDRTQVTKQSFSLFFDRMLKNLRERTGQSISKKDIADMLDIDYELFRHYVNKSKVLKKRDCVIAICAMLQADTSDTNDGLYYYDMEELNDYDPRDEMLMNILDEQSQIFLNIDTINEKLKGEYFPELDIIEHRKKKDIVKPKYPFRVVKTSIECRTDELIYGDPYDSLDTAYKRLCRIYAFMWLDDNGRKGYELCAEPDGFLSCTEYPMKGKWYHKYDSPDDAGIFKSCFIELQRMAIAEKRRMAEFLRDTRNYHERISAKVIENELHVFYETYNYTVPELGEYYLMDYVNGEYTLYVSHESRFMRYYLSEQEYLDLFGRLSDKYDEHYSSVEQIDSAVAVSQDRKDIIRLRVRAFRNAQDKVNSLIDKLKSGQAHIRNLKEIYDNELDVLSYYKVEEAFQCSYDPEYGEIDGVGIDKVSFTLPNDVKVELSLDDLCAGFRLGLSTLEEVGAFLTTHKTFDLAELLDDGTC